MSVPDSNNSQRLPQTLVGMAGGKPEPGRLSDSVLIIIDAQREYVDGKLPLDGVQASLNQAALLLERARRAATPVIHVVHHGKPGAAVFDPQGVFVEVAGAVAPKPGETVIIKTLPNAFTGTALEEQLARIGRKDLIVVGYMTHMCVSSTVRAALDHGYRATLVAGATATRALPSTDAGTISAQDLQRASLAALADRFATVVRQAADIPE